MRGDLLRAGAPAEAEVAETVAERTGTDLSRDMYPHLVAAVVLAANNVALAHFQRADPPVAMPQLLTDALAGIAAGPPPP
ncbi:acyl-CoA-like ligand-binding transcription factor [Actinoplanes auranticolor]|uniref:MftR C-terminal domain-containing protein n=1 Tax=Actinoplanes auranticolor TaxID=47988 RepID=A0A919VS56_9ACTN|nr:hypothetical protein [Actinoplanes auranticolor]GIM73510.1 hypothetical protein Aau02nite_56400 [Actinoplanes auranticolor]